METRLACEAAGLDPDLGLLRTDDRLRQSFIYDLLEPRRLKADVWALELLLKENPDPAMFHDRAMALLASIRSGRPPRHDADGMVPRGCLPWRSPTTGPRAAAPDYRNAAACPRGAKADCREARHLGAPGMRLLEGTAPAQKPEVL